jgi:hypothetical protein
MKFFAVLASIHGIAFVARWASKSLVAREAVGFLLHMGGKNRLSWSLEFDGLWWSV